MTPPRKKPLDASPGAHDGEDRSTSISATPPTELEAAREALAAAEATLAQTRAEADAIASTPGFAEQRAKLNAWKKDLVDKVREARSEIRRRLAIAAGAPTADARAARIWADEIDARERAAERAVDQLSEIPLYEFDGSLGFPPHDILVAHRSALEAASRAETYVEVCRWRATKLEAEEKATKLEAEHADLRARLPQLRERVAVALNAGKRDEWEEAARELAFVEAREPNTAAALRAAHAELNDARHELGKREPPPPRPAAEFDARLAWANPVRF